MWLIGCEMISAVVPSSSTRSCSSPEFTHLRGYGSAISGCESQKLAHGPARRRLLPVRRQLVERDDAEMVNDDVYGRPQHLLLPKRAGDLTVFSARELDTINEVLTSFATLTAAHEHRRDDSVLVSVPRVPAACDTCDDQARA